MSLFNSILGIGGGLYPGRNISLLSDLYIYYKFENNLLDSSGNNVTATGPTVSYTSSGKYGYAFENTTDVGTNALYIPYTNLLNGNADNISIFAWVYISNLAGSSSSFHTIASRLAAGTIFYLDIINNGSITCALGTGSVTTSIGTISNGTWNYIGFTYNNNILKLYLNGSMIGSSTIGPYSIYDASESVYIGTNKVYSDVLNGRIDEFTLWGRELQSSEISYIYNLGGPLIP